MTESGKDDEITRPTVWSAICLTVVQTSILFPQSSHIFAAFAESSGPRCSDGGSTDSGDAENTDAALNFSSRPPTSPIAMRIVNSLISLRRPILDAFSCDNDREAGTSIDVRRNPELIGELGLPNCRLGRKPPLASNGARNEEEGFPPPPGPPKNTTLG